MSIQNKVTVFTKTIDAIKAIAEPKSNSKQIILWDAIAIVLIAILTSAYASFATKLTNKLVGGRTSQQILNQLLVESPEVATQFLHSVQFLVIYSIAGAVILLILAAIIYIFTREIMYQLVHKKQQLSLSEQMSLAFTQTKKNSLKWIAVGFLTTISLILTAAVLLIVRYLIQLLIQLITQNAYHTSTYIQLFNPLFLVIGMTVIITAEFFFTKHKKVWGDFGDAITLYFNNFVGIFFVSLTYFVAVLILYFGIIRMIYQYVFATNIKTAIDLICLVLLFALLKVSLINIFTNKSSKK